MSNDKRDTTDDDLIRRGDVDATLCAAHKGWPLDAPLVINIFTKLRDDVRSLPTASPPDVAALRREVERLGSALVAADARADAEKARADAAEQRGDDARRQAWGSRDERNEARFRLTALREVVREVVRECDAGEHEALREIAGHALEVAASEEMWTAEKFSPGEAASIATARVNRYASKPLRAAFDAAPAPTEHPEAAALRGAAEHARAVADECDNPAGACAREHRQLATWLDELACRPAAPAPASAPTEPSPPRVEPGLREAALRRMDRLVDELKEWHELAVVASIARADIAALAARVPTREELGRMLCEAMENNPWERHGDQFRDDISLAGVRFYAALTGRAEAPSASQRDAALDEAARVVDSVPDGDDVSLPSLAQAIRDLKGARASEAPSAGEAPTGGTLRALTVEEVARQEAMERAAPPKAEPVVERARTVPLEAPPDVPPCHIGTTPEEWMDAHTKVTHHTAIGVTAWGAVCNTCCATWSRDPAVGGAARNAPSPEPRDGTAEPRAKRGPRMVPKIVNWLRRHERRAIRRAASFGLPAAQFDALTPQEQAEIAARCEFWLARADLAGRIADRLMARRALLPAAPRACEPCESRRIRNEFAKWVICEAKQKAIISNYTLHELAGIIDKALPAGCGGEMCRGAK